MPRIDSAFIAWAVLVFAATAILYAWLFNSTRASLLIVLVAHGAYDIDNSIVQSPGAGLHSIPIIVAALHGLAAMAVIVGRVRAR